MHAVKPDASPPCSFRNREKRVWCIRFYRMHHLYLPYNLARRVADQQSACTFSIENLLKHWNFSYFRIYPDQFHAFPTNCPGARNKNTTILLTLGALPCEIHEIHEIMNEIYIINDNFECFLYKLIKSSTQNMENPWKIQTFLKVLPRSNKC